MSLTKKYIGNLYLTNRFYIGFAACIILFVFSYFFPAIARLPKYVLLVFVSLFLIDYIFLFFIGKGAGATRTMADRLSNGDENKITIVVKSNSPFAVKMELIDELPVQFQTRDWGMEQFFKPWEEKEIRYNLRPIERGEYSFGNLLLYLQTRLGIVVRRIEAAQETTVPVYPSYIQMRKYELMSQTTVKNEHGSKKVRKLGHSMEFEQIKEYVSGDDVRTINWKATARKGSLMVNNYTDEKSQQVYCLIDKGRLMKMPFNGLTLLDYAINSTLVLSNVCLQKQDRIGLVTFSNKMGTLLPAEKKPIQRANILQLLYNQETNFMESDYEMLYMQIRKRIKQRSLLILFTNFESLQGMKRQLSYLRTIAKHHLLMVVFFENTELKTLTTMQAKNTEDVYIKTIGEKFAFEKRVIVKELMKHGILAVLTSPENLTVDAVNKYLELKARRVN